MIKLRIAEYRKKHDLTQVALAKRLGVSFQTISKWENGKNYPDIEMLSDISDVFGVSMEELIGKKENNLSLEKQSSSKYWGKKIDYLLDTRKELWNDDYLEFLVEKVWKIREAVSILDYGCGFGYLGMKLMPLLPEGSSYTGLDISKELINEGKKGFQNSEFDTEFIQCDLYEYFPKQKYDIVISQALLRHSDRPETIMKKMYSSVKTNGLMICIDVNRIYEEAGYINSRLEYNPFDQLRVFEKLWSEELKNGGRDYSMGSKLASLMNNIGLKDIQSRMNDKVIVATQLEDFTSIKEAKGWNHKYDNESYHRIRTHFLQKGIPINEIDLYIDRLKNNLIDLNDPSYEGCISFFRGMVITWGKNTE